jgi:hypothetical protein
MPNRRRTKYRTSLRQKGFSMQPFSYDFGTLETLLASLMDGHVSYRLGAKCGHASRDAPADIPALDCSGLIEYLFYRISNPNTDIPSGSSNQEDWFEERYPRVNYEDAARHDSHLRIAFRDRRGTVIRHVWFVVNGRTIESTTRGDNNGPTSLPWDARLSEADDCFLLGPLLPMRFDIGWLPPDRWLPAAAGALLRAAGTPVIAAVRGAARVASAVVPLTRRGQ